ncbi:cbl-interacting serine/threonine-protein kinase 24 [Phtheirospermum japonicum]|uniref:non-specific serine/threonine protein kinase n=1 Tax=Phtheirospermum japonicum TaxID=374723 RepID=A0A830DFW2_9LAMI|nr:cbl-interacting serine/threonine-protein kinase 24 [Phtheirospermum japonicum]
MTGLGAAVGNERCQKKMKAVKRKVGKYELGRTVGEGTFAKVKFAQNTETGDSVAIKVLAKSTILKHKMVDQARVAHRNKQQSYQLSNS